MKITVSELLGLVKDSKQPRKIKYDGRIWQADYALGDYVNDQQWMFEKYFKERSAKGFVNDEVEIIEDKKIPEKFVFGRIEDQEHYNIKKKINDIIDFLKSKGE